MFLTAEPISNHILVHHNLDTAELEDGSIWKISLYDQSKLAQWHPNDPLSVTQNAKWFSSYNYRWINHRSGECIETNLISNGAALFLTAIDHQTLTLSNQTTWTFKDPCDWPSSLPVLIGDNCDDLHQQWPYLLIDETNPQNYIHIRL
jgi:hypothetical protein